MNNMRWMKVVVCVILRPFCKLGIENLPEVEMALAQKNGSELQRLVREWRRMLDQAANRLLAMGNDYRMVSKIRNMVFKAQNELRKMEYAAGRGADDKSTRRELVRVSQEATTVLADTSRVIDEMAMGIQMLAKQDRRCGHLKTGADQVRRETHRMKDHLGLVTAELDKLIAAEIEKTVSPPSISELKNKTPVEVQMLEPVRKLYLQHRRYVRFSIKGPAGWYAEVSIQHVPGTGGHEQGINGNKEFNKMVGGFIFARHHNVKKEIEKAQKVVFRLPENGEPVIIEFKAADLSGTFEFYVKVDAEEKYLDRPHQIQPIRPEEYKRFLVDFIYQPGLESLYKHQMKNMYLYQGDRESQFHSSENSHYATSELIGKIREVVRLFNAKYSESKVWINDISLPWGGTFKTKNDYYSRSHEGHKDGKKVDLSFNNLSNRAERIYFDEVVQKVFANHSYDFHGSIGYWHWHCSIDKKDTIKHGMFAALKYQYDKLINDERLLDNFFVELRKRGIEKDFKYIIEPKLRKNILWFLDPDWFGGDLQSDE